MSSVATAFDSLAPWIRDWIRCEQTANDRVSHPRLKHHFALDEKHLEKGYWPESREVFQLEYVLLNRASVLEFGPAAGFIAERFGLRAPRGKRLIFIHPGNKPIKRKLQRAGIPIRLSEIVATPTSSFRSLLCWHPSAPERAAIVKLALHIPISGVKRFLGELEVVGSVHTSLLLSEIPSAHKEQIGFDFFADVAGSHCRSLNLGQLFRTLPAPTQPRARLVPGFSFGSKQDGELYLRRTTKSGAHATALMANLIASYVRTTSYLLFHEGIAHEFHPQNVLFEVQGERVLRVVLRDFYRAAVSPALRARRGRPFPEWKDGQQSRYAPSRYLFFRMAQRAPTAYLRVFGVRGVVWEWSRALRLLGVKQKPTALQQMYLRYWQEASAVWLGVWPRRLPTGPSLALNDAIALFLSQKG